MNLHDGLRQVWMKLDLANCYDNSYAMSARRRDGLSAGEVPEESESFTSIVE